MAIAIVALAGVVFRGTLYYRADVLKVMKDRDEERAIILAKAFERERAMTEAMTRLSDRMAEANATNEHLVKALTRCEDHQDIVRRLIDKGAHS
jgi:hypothetical protein